MNGMPPMVREFMGSPRRDNCQCEIEQIELLSDAARDSVLDGPGMLKSFRQDFYSRLVSEKWQLDFEFGDFPRMGRARAAITLDAVKNVKCTDCNHHHRLFVEMCTDNRQAILVNLMKLEFASRRFREKYPDGYACGIGIFVTDSRKDALKLKGYVDGSIGSLEEYEIQATGPWEGLVTSRLLALTI